VSYAYISSPGTPEERIQKAMYSLGLPILQGGGSTIIGVFALVFISSYIFQVFFKVVFLVIVCAGFHGLFVLPVLLVFIKPESMCKSVSNKKGSFNLDHPQA
jgi:predicted RND superfamily exporter protein